VYRPYLVKLIGQTSSFMRFDNLAGALYVTPTQQSIIVGALTGLIAASSGLFIAWRSTGETITSFKRNAARATNAWWAADVSGCDSVGSRLLRAADTETQAVCKRR